MQATAGKQNKAQELLELEVDVHYAGQLRTPILMLAEHPSMFRSTGLQTHVFTLMHLIT